MYLGLDCGTRGFHKEGPVPLPLKAAPRRKLPRRKHVLPIKWQSPTERNKSEEW